ncbi:hypothetical protein [Nonomuraea diastatica]|uniref:Uncharacterized protein n=1 Tax=Nonomuraea diastatica TaxID=1848329 RepID=A0A4R4WN32_9ACTN|nr:hypothetical protein [Nonomuraea diastatica]TDD15300.1 hypothetical protein E1294_34930 [Nonomuraea diastatica]
MKRSKAGVLLLSPALIAALAVEPAVASDVSAASIVQNLTATTSTTMHSATEELAQPPRRRAKRRRYNQGRRDGFADGRNDCRSGRSHDLQTSGSGAYRRGFRDGYNEGFHSCTRPTPTPSPTTPAPGGGGGGT